MVTLDPGASKRKRLRYTSWPKRPGMMAFNLDKGMAETPYQNSKKRRSTHCVPSVEDVVDNSQAFYSRQGLYDMSTEEHSKLAIAELGAIDKAYQPDGCSSRPFSFDLQDPRSINSASGKGHQPEATTIASSSHATSHLIDDDEYEHPPLELLKDLETRRINPQQPIQEVKGIDADLVLVTVEKKCDKIVSEQAQTTKQFIGEQWQTLVTLHRTLLNNHHDFFSASQQPDAPPELRTLASKYMSSRRYKNRNLFPVLEFLRQQANYAPDKMHTMLDVTFGMLNRLMREVPSFTQEWQDWNIVAGNLHHYVFGLRQGGVNIPETHPELWSRRSWLQTVNEEDIECTKRLSAIGCDFIDDWISQRQLLTPSVSEEDVEEDPLRDLHLEFDDLFWAFMAGWYEIGGMIARTPRDFLKVFTFLPWAVWSIY